jgi:hypothetical protein
MANAQAGSSRQAGRNRVVISDEEDSEDERQTKPVAGDAMEDDDDQLHLWTIDSYQPQTKQKDPYSDASVSSSSPGRPITGWRVDQLKKLGKDIGDMIDNISTGMTRVTETAVVIEENSPGDEVRSLKITKGYMLKLHRWSKNSLKGFVDLWRWNTFWNWRLLYWRTFKQGYKEEKILYISFQTLVWALKLIKQTDPAALFEKETSDRTEAYMKKTPRQKCKLSRAKNRVWRADDQVSDDESYSFFRGEVWVRALSTFFLVHTLMK